MTVANSLVERVGWPESLGISDEIARRTAQDWRAYDGMAFAHFEQLKMMLDKKEPSYRE